MNFDNLEKTLELLRLSMELCPAKDPESIKAQAEDLFYFHQKLLRAGAELASPVPPTFIPPVSNIELAGSTKIQHPTSGPVDLRLYDFQENLLKWLDDGSRLKLIVKSRQMGITTIMALQAFWVAISKPDQTVVIVSNKFASAIEIMDRIRFMMSTSTANLPRTLEYNKGFLRFENGSRIIARACNEHAVRGLSIDVLLIDEAAFISHKLLNEFWHAARPIIGVSGKIIIASTPHYTEGLFYQLFRSAPGNGFEVHDVHWTDHPDRDDAWANLQKSYLGAHKFANEYEGKFTVKPQGL